MNFSSARRICWRVLKCIPRQISSRSQRQSISKVYCGLIWKPRSWNAKSVRSAGAERLLEEIERRQLVEQRPHDPQASLQLCLWLARSGIHRRTEQVGEGWHPQNRQPQLPRHHVRQPADDLVPARHSHFFEPTLRRRGQPPVFMKQQPGTTARGLPRADPPAIILCRPQTAVATERTTSTISRSAPIARAGAEPSPGNPRGSAAWSDMASVRRRAVGNGAAGDRLRTRDRGRDLPSHQTSLRWPYSARPRRQASRRSCKCSISEITIDTDCQVAAIFGSARRRVARCRSGRMPAAGLGSRKATISRLTMSDFWPAGNGCRRR